MRDVVGHSETTEVVVPTFPTSTSTPSPTEVSAIQDWVSYPSLNDIRSLAFASDGSLWTGTGSGVVRWDLAADTHIRYSAADGLASDDITDLAFAPDGTLWAAARGGVSRFDGTGWTSYTEADGLISNIVYAIAVAADGSVWVGTQDGASHFDCKRGDAVWTSYTMADGLADNVVWYVAVAPDGDVWFSTHSGGVSRHNPDQNTWTTYNTEHGLSLPNARFLTIGPDGALWLHIGYGHVYRFDGTTWQVAYKAGGGQWVCEIGFAADNSPWIATCDGYHAHGAGLAHLDGTAWTYVTTKDGLVDNDVSAVAVAPDGTIAAGTDRGLSVYQTGQWRTLRSGPTLSRVTPLAVTPDGALWLGFGDATFRPAGGGLSRFDGQSWQYVSRANGFPISDNVRTLAVAPDGALWAGAGCGVARLENPTEAAESGQAWQAIATCDDLHGNVHTIAFAPDGSVWIATDFNLYHLNGREWIVYESKMPGSLAVAPDNTLWVAHSPFAGGELSAFDGHVWTNYAESLPIEQLVTALVVTADGAVWAGARHGGLARFDGQSWKKFTTADGGLVSDQIVALAVSPDDVLWAITDVDLAHFDGKAWKSICFDRGPGTINAMDFAPDGSLWLGTSRGAVHFRLPETTLTQSMKGYELYSWQVGEDWHFALVVGTNRIKTFDEIAAPEVCVRGLEALAGQLDQLPGGEQVFWSARRVPNVGLRPADVVEQVKAYCEQRGIQLEVEPLPPQPTSGTLCKHPASLECQEGIHH